MNLRIHPWLDQLGVYEPGRPIEEVARAFGFSDSDGIIKLASNENPLGPPPKALRAMRQAAKAMHLYPDGGSFYIRQALAERLRVGPDKIIMGQGSNELIVLLGQIALEPGARMVCSAGAFAIYKLMARLFRAEAVEAPMKHFTHDLDAMRERVDGNTRLVMIGNPNNPTGTMVEGASLDRFIESLPPDLLVVVDEAYVELLPPERQPDVLRHVREGRAVVVLRTFSKAYGLAGLRLGYAVGPREAVDAMNRVRQPFNVSAMAQAAAMAALNDEAYVARTRRLVASGLKQLEKGCRALKLEWIPSTVNFMMIRVGRGREIFDRLQRRGVIVRPMDGYGWPEYIRVTVGTREENARFLNELGAVWTEEAP